MASKAEELRVRLARCGPRRRGRVIGSDLREAIREYAIERMKIGEGVNAVARELDVSSESLRRWTAMTTFVPVTVSDPGGTYAVTGGCGVRVEGLSLTEVAQLLRLVS